MKCFGKTAGKLLIVLAVIFISCGTCFAGYPVDDLMGNAYKSQWMIINKSGGTYGGNYDEALVVSSDIIGWGSENSVINVLNGYSDDGISDHELHVLFLLLSQGYGRLKMNFKAEDLSFDVSTPNLDLSTLYDIDSTPYVDCKEAKGQPEGDKYDASWRQYEFQIGRQVDGRDIYDTVVQSFNFQQNPRKEASQTIPRPIVISNVYPGTARNMPLILRMTLRDSSTANGNIVAYDRSTWDMTGDKTAGGNHWVFVPVDDLITDNKRINYYLTTEVVNHSAVRYAAAPYDSYGTQEFPDYWKFDLLRSQGTTDIDASFQLSRTSHIAPGLVSVFRRRYNINEQNKRPLRLYPVDVPAENGRFDLRLNHRIIYGKPLGEKYTQSAAEGKFSLFEIQPFQPKTVSMNFFETVKEVTRASGDVKTPTTQFFTGSSVKRSDTVPGIGSLTQFFTIDQTIPGSLRNEDTEGMLPLHITFNIPVTLVDDKEWLNSLIDEWRTSGRIEGLFSEKYEIFLLTETSGDINPWNLTQELLNSSHDGKNYYNEQIKVFYDEERGRAGQDNDRGVITVSFIVMLMDGTRDGVRPELSMVQDYSISQENDYIIIRDGTNDNKWKMTFFIAPTGYRDNPASGDVESAGGNSENNRGYRSTDSGSGAGCNLSLGALCFMALFAIVATKRG